MNREEIKKSLLSQLKSINASLNHYEDLINDYMDMWVTKSLLVDDIQQRGVTVTYDNGGGQRGAKKNDSIEQRIKVNAQMLKLLNELGIKPTQGGEGNDEEM